MITGSYRDKEPSIHETAYIAKGAVVIGDVEIGAGSSIWFNAIVRGDMEQVKIGDGTNIQDGSVVHVSTGFPCVLGNNVVVGHNVIIHGCSVADNCVVGMGSTILDGAEIGEGSIIAAGSVVTPGKKFPARSFLLGTPARLIREVTDEEVAVNSAIALHYIERAKEYRAGGY